MANKQNKQKGASKAPPPSNPPPWPWIILKPPQPLADHDVQSGKPASTGEPSPQADDPRIYTEEIACQDDLNYNMNFLCQDGRKNGVPGDIEYILEHDIHWQKNWPSAVHKTTPFTCSKCGSRSAIHAISGQQIHCGLIPKHEVFSRVCADFKAKIMTGLLWSLKCNSWELLRGIRAFGILLKGNLHTFFELIPSCFSVHEMVAMETSMLCLSPNCCWTSSK